MRSDLIDLATSCWRRYGTTLANPETRFFRELIEEAIAAGCCERLASVAPTGCRIGQESEQELLGESAPALPPNGRSGARHGSGIRSVKSNSNDCHRR